MVRAEYAPGDVMRVTLPNGHVSFNVWQKDDYWLCWVQAGEAVIRADDVKCDSRGHATVRAEDLYSDQWAALCTLDMVGAPSG